jgi:hypothetical protein
VFVVVCFSFLPGRKGVLGFFLREEEAMASLAGTAAVQWGQAAMASQQGGSKKRSKRLCCSAKTAAAAKSGVNLMRQQIAGEPLRLQQVGNVCYHRNLSTGIVRCTLATEEPPRGNQSIYYA